MKRIQVLAGTGLAAAIAVIIIATAPGDTAAAQNLGAHSIGYVGCSNTGYSVLGYTGAAGNRALFWNPIGYGTGGGTIDQWANPTSGYWIGTDGFSAQLTKYGQPKEIWIQLCENYSKTPGSYAQVQQLFMNLKQHSPGASYYVSAINIYSPFTMCAMMGPNGQGETDTEKWRDQAVAAGLALRGPDMGLLTAATTVNDRCHPNTAGEEVLGSELFQFFDAGTPNVTPTPTATPACNLKPNRPAAASPPNGATVQGPQVILSWKASNCASTYTVTVRRNSTQGAIVAQSGNLAALQYMTPPLAGGKTYYWRVTACNSIGCLSSTWRHFTVSSG